MTIILNSTVLNELVDNDVLKVLKKNQKTQDNCNYYFNPNIGFKLYDAKVKYVDKKSMVFEFDKYKYSSLLVLLNYTNDVLQRMTKQNFSELFEKSIYGIVSEQDSTFTIRCYLPNYNGKYFIETESDDKFKLPRSGCIYDSVTVEIRNIWKMGEKYGFNLELKGVYVNYNKL